MLFEAANCPSCGANIRVPNDTERANCMYCGQSIIVKEAIQKFKVEVSGQVDVSGISSVKNDILRGNQCLSAKDWIKAHEIFAIAISKVATNYDAWYGCLVAQTQNFVDICGWVELDGAHGIESTIRNSIKYATDGQKKQILLKITKILKLMQKAEKEYYNNQLERKKRRKNKGVTLIIIGLIGAALLIWAAFADGGLLGAIYGILGCIVGAVFLISGGLTISAIDDNLHDETTLQYIKRLHKVISIYK